MRSLHPAAADHSVSIRGSRCTALIILSLQSRAEVVEATALLPQNVECSGKRVRALRRGSSGHGRTGEKKIIFLLTATPGVCGGQLPCMLQH